MRLCSFQPSSIVAFLTVSALTLIGLSGWLVQRSIGVLAAADQTTLRKQLLQHLLEYLVAYASLAP